MRAAGSVTVIVFVVVHPLKSRIVMLWTPATVLKILLDHIDLSDEIYRNCVYCLNYVNPKIYIFENYFTYFLIYLHHTNHRNSIILLDHVKHKINNNKFDLTWASIILKHYDVNIQKYI